MSDASRQALLLDAMGISRWVRRDLPGEMKPTGNKPAASLERLAAEVAACTRCGLCEGRTQTVFGTGDPAADLMLVGEGPGAEEDKQGEPFVGQAGRLLNRMLQAIGLKREEVYIANIIKCRPPSNRDPRPEEVDACMPHLMQQIELIQPKLILALGRVAAQSLLNETRPLGRMRRQIHSIPARDTPVVVTYHPAYLLRSPGQKRKAWEDLCFARKLYSEQVAP